MRVDAERVAYAFDPVKTRLYVTWRGLKTPAVPREEFAQVASDIHRAHTKLMLELGVDPQQVFFVDFRETLSQASANPKASGRLTCRS